MLRYKKIIIVGLSVLILILLSIIIYNVLYLPNVNVNKKKPNLNIEEKSITICKEGIDCGIGTINYRTISTDINSNKLKNKIDELNAKVNDLYLKSYNSLNMFGDECNAVINLYQRSIMTESFLEYYESNKLLSFTLVNSETNLCTNVHDSNLDIVYYDIKKDKFLKESEIKTKYDINDEEVLKLIEKNINESNLNDFTNYSMNILDYHIYISNDGELSVYYKLADNNIYYSVPLGIKV